MNTKWTQVTQADEPSKSDGIDFTFTPQERDKALIAVLEKEAYVRSFGRDTSGLEVGYVAPSDLTNSERAAFGMGGV